MPSSGEYHFAVEHQGGASPAAWGRTFQVKRLGGQVLQARRRHEMQKDLIDDITDPGDPIFYLFWLTVWFAWPLWVGYYIFDEFF